MKLNHDCVRDLLLYLEDNLNFNNEIKINKLNLRDYSQEDLLYTAQKLIEANYINCVTSRYYDNKLPFILVKSITFEGHQFLDNIRDENVYSKTKTILSTFKSVSIDIFSETASKVITALISKQIGLS